MHKSPTVKQVKLSKEDHALVLKYPDAYACADAFLRIDEIFSHLKDFTKRNLSRSELQERYYHRTKKTDYQEKWAGYCLSGKAILRVTQNCDDLSTRERELKIICFEEEVTLDTVVIAYAAGYSDTYNHELAHAFYAANDQYRDKMNSLMVDIPFLPEFEKVLTKLGYNNLILKDEFQAYMTGGLSNYGFTKSLIEKMRPLQARFRNVLNKAKRGDYNG